ncbi:MAG: response regulator [Xanthobacteraceae bacterium]|nr:MAG: response regulator [Xanthobacteraceae bacterium]
MNGKASPLRGFRILVAEDEIIVALGLEATLREAGADVVGPCATLPAALQAAQDEKLSAAVLDVQLGRDTTEAVALLLSSRKIPYLFYSGQQLSAEFRARAPDAPSLIKPVAQKVLVDAVAGLLDTGDEQTAALADPA